MWHGRLGGAVAGGSAGAWRRSGQRGKFVNTGCSVLLSLNVCVIITASLGAAVAGPVVHGAACLQASCQAPASNLCIMRHEAAHLF